MKISFYKIILLLICTTLSLQSTAQVVSDADGNEYDTVVIGTQVWLNASLRTTHFSNGDLIPTTSPATLNVNGESAPIYQWSYNGIDSLAGIYGRLYTWYAVADDRNVCPIGWHVPSTPEFQTLINYLGGTSVAGGKLKETGNDHWNAPNTGATNETGFTAVGNGNRNLLGYFNDMGLVSDMWSTTEGVQGAWDCDLHAESPSTTANDDPKGFGFAVRCVRDLPYFSIPPTEDSETIYLYPNPAQDKFTVDIKNYGVTDYTLLSLSGDFISTGALNSGINSIGIEWLEAGVYILQLTGDGQPVTLKFVKVP